MGRVTVLSFYRAIFWILPFAGLVLGLGLVETVVGRLVVLALMILAMIAPWRKWIEFTLLLGVFSFVMVINSWVYAGTMSHFLGTVAVFITIVTVGLSASNASSTAGRAVPLWVYWPIVGLVISQINSLTFYLPFSFVEQTLLSVLFFYYLWYWLERFPEAPPRRRLSHLVYVSVLAIVIVGEAIWSNFLQ